MLSLSSGQGKKNYFLFLGDLASPWGDRAGKGLRSKREWLFLYSRSLDLQLCGTSVTTS